MPGFHLPFLFFPDFIELGLILLLLEPVQILLLASFQIPQFILMRPNRIILGLLLKFKILPLPFLDILLPVSFLLLNQFAVGILEFNGFQSFLLLFLQLLLFSLFVFILHLAHEIELMNLLSVVEFLLGLEFFLELLNQVSVQCLFLLGFKLPPTLNLLHLLIPCDLFQAVLLLLFIDFPLFLLQEQSQHFLLVIHVSMLIHLLLLLNPLLFQHLFIQLTTVLLFCIEFPQPKQLLLSLK